MAYSLKGLADTFMVTINVMVITMKDRGISDHELIDNHTHFS